MNAVRVLLAVALVAMLTPAVGAARPGPTVGAASPPVDSGPSLTAELALRSASASLATGHGPAAGVPSACVGSAAAPSSCGPAATAPPNGSTPRWTSEPRLPFSRFGSLVAYDAADGYVVVFGGNIATGYAYQTSASNETWAYSDGTWQNLTPALKRSPPPATTTTGLLVDDPADGYLLLYEVVWEVINFTGTEVGQTWTYAGNAWTLRNTTMSPGAVSQASAVYDSADGYVLLFGGSTSRTTWIFSHGNWSTAATPISPWARWGAFMYVEPSSGYVLLYGGSELISGSNVVSNDTWSYHQGNWTQVYPSVNTSALGRPTVWGVVALAADPATGSIVAIASCGEDGSNELFEYSARNWTNLSGCDYGGLVGLTYDAADAALVILNGYRWYDAYDPTWLTASALTGRTLQPLAPEAPGIPEPTAAPQVADDPADGALVYFSNDYYASTWKWNGTAWSTWAGTHGKTPGGTCTGPMTYDAADGYVLLFCGETWTFRGGNWSQATQSLTDDWPAEDTGQAMAYDATDGYVLLFGGGSTNETWAWSAGNWTNLTSLAGTAPSPRRGAAMAYDAADREVVLFGGWTSAGGLRDANDTWAFSGGRWAHLAPVASPVGRALASMTFDAGTGYLLLFGGEEVAVAYGASPWLGDTWAFAGGNWTRLASASSAVPGSSPSPRGSAAVAYSPESGSVVLLGGWGEYQANPGYWLWGVPAVPPRLEISALTVTPGPTEVGVSTNLTTTVVGGTPPLSYAYANLPPGCTSADSRVVRCSPTAIGNYTVLATITDSAGSNATGNLSVDVVAPPVLTSFQIVPSIIELGESSVLIENWTGGTSPFTVSYAGPPGCSGTRSLDSLCTPEAIGEYTVVVTVRDALGAETTGAANLTVTKIPVPLVLDSFAVSPSEITEGATVLVAATVSGGSGGPEFNYTGLPPGCRSENLSSFFCTPSSVGAFTLEVRVTDSTTGASVNGSALLLVAAVSTGGSTNSTPPLVVVGFNVTPGELTLGAPVTLEVAVAGGSLPYSYAYAGLPEGCVTTDAPTLTCTPATTGAYPLLVTVTDASHRDAQRFASLSVVSPTAPPPPPTPPAGPPMIRLTPTPAPLWSSTGGLAVPATDLLAAAAFVAATLVGLVAVLVWSRPTPPPGRPPPSTSPVLAPMDDLRRKG